MTKGVTTGAHCLEGGRLRLGLEGGCVRLARQGTSALSKRRAEKLSDQ